MTASDAVAEALRSAYPQALARVLGITRELATAEDALQDAVVRALQSWPERGIPEVPTAWLVTAARRRHIDRLRHQTHVQRHRDVVARLAEMRPRSRLRSRFDGPPENRWDDDLLRLLVTCCHPALGLAERTALTLSTVLGLSTTELARAFLVAPRTMEQRLTRARRRLRERTDAYQVPEQAIAGRRLDAVLAVIHLLHNEGYWASQPAPAIRGELCALALELAESLRRLLPTEPEVIGLVALLLLHRGRQPARLSPTGEAVALPDQDRSLWVADDLARGSALVERAAALGRPGRYQIEAAIAAEHCRVRDAQATDWASIALLYDALEAVTPSPVVRINRAFAIARSGHPAAALALLQPVVDERPLRDYPYTHAIHGAILEDLGRRAEAIAAYRRALSLTDNRHERAHLGRRLDRLAGAVGPGASEPPPT